MKTNLIQKFENITYAQKHLLAILLIALVIMICFSNSLSVEFVYDDFVIIQDNPNIKSLSNIPQLFFQTYWGTNPNSGNYRPLTNVSFALNFAISGLNAYSYHLFNILIHYANCLLVYWLCEHYLERKLLALFCSLLFAVHPIHSEAVAAVYGRPEILASFFLLISWLTYSKSRSYGYFYIVSLISYFFALLSKESGIVLFGILWLVQICRESSWKDKLIPHKKLLGYVLTTMPYLIIRVLVTKSLGVNNSEHFFKGESFLTRLYTMSLGYIEYFRLLIWPVNLYTEYDYNVIPKATTLGIPIILSLGLILLLIGVGIWQIKHKPVIAFAILFFFVTTSIVSNIFIPTGILMAERAIYLGVASICLLFAVVVYAFYEKEWKKLSIVIFIILLTFASIRTYLRNFDFHNNLAIFSSIIKLVPKQSKANYGLGLYYEEAKEFSKAEAYFKKALEISPNSSSVYVIMGNFYNKQGRNDLAMPMLKKALELDANNFEAQSFYGAGLLAQGNLCEAKKHIEKAISLNKNLVKAHNNLGIAYAELGIYDKAKKEFETAINLDPEYLQAKENLKLLEEKINSSSKAIDCPE